MLPLIKIGETVIYTYPLVIGIALSLFYSLADFHNQKSRNPLKSFPFFFTGLIVASFLCAKFLFFVTHEEKIPIDAFFFTGGGLVFYGALLGGLLYIFIYGEFHRRKFEDFNFLIPAICFSHALGRLGCFLAGCCYGKFCDLPWAIHSKHPVQIYESIFVFILGVFFWSERRRSFKLYLLGYGLIRFILEFFRGDEIRGFFGVFSTSQIIAILMIIVSSILVLKEKKLKS